MIELIIKKKWCRLLRINISVGGGLTILKCSRGEFFLTKLSISCRISEESFSNSKQSLNGVQQRCLTYEAEVVYVIVTIYITEHVIWGKRYNMDKTWFVYEPDFERNLTGSLPKFVYVPGCVSSRENVCITLVDQYLILGDVVPNWNSEV